MNFIGAIIESIGYAAESLYTLVLPGDGKWSKRSYYSSGIALMIAAVLGTDALAYNIVPFNSIMATVFFFLFVTLFILTPIIREAELDSAISKENRAPTKRSRVRLTRGTSVAEQPPRQSSPPPHR